MQNNQVNDGTPIRATSGAFQTVDHQHDQFWPEIFRQLQTYSINERIREDQLRNGTAATPRLVSETSCTKADAVQPAVRTVVTEPLGTSAGSAALPHLEVGVERRAANRTAFNTDQQTADALRGNESLPSQLMAAALHLERKAADNRYNAATVPSGTRNQSQSTSLPAVSIC